MQQTQVPRVIIEYQEFLSKFPSLQDLAKSSKAEVIQSWSGLGYNRRALLLHKFAQEVVEKYQGIIPSNKEKLAELPGIGPYTCGSVLSFAYNLPEPAIDVNVRRIYMRYFHGQDQGLPMGKKEENILFELIKSTIPVNKSSQLHNALMDFGSLVCLRDAPMCAQCPLQATCTFFPLYKDSPKQVLFVMEKKQEQGKKEGTRFIPNRIYRGRILELTRKKQETKLTLKELGKKVKKDYTSKDQHWLLDLCARLQKEGFLDYTLTENFITLTLANS